MIDNLATRYDAQERIQTAFEKRNGTQPDLTTRLEARDSFLTTRVFEVPRDAKAFFLGDRDGMGSPFPEMFIIGTGIRQPPLIRLQKDSATLGRGDRPMLPTDKLYGILLRPLTFAFHSAK